MSLPQVLKNYNVFQDSDNWAGLISSFTRPKLTRKTEDVNNGGMAGPVEIDMGQDKVECSFSGNGFLISALRAYAATTVDAVGLRFVGAYQNDATGAYASVEVYVRGRYKEIDPGDAKTQTVGEFKYIMPCAYYRETINGKVMIEYDALNNILIVDGIDVLAAQRAAMGSWIV
ncbi:P2 family phage contractile tail tube protein [Luteibacter sp. 1214]|uniref:phage major tail tube protein n=1 Tax=Luteibacter sp. 1214 TaxID=2817735 RepID=UPI00285EE30B|nr:phage major tail tube protein [Luteibacter sp. 1214]MDR6642775.1 P2 family phage contractile tail tube protein [Luteibacter sp. 1214]